jgi:hypothetical protein
VSKPVPERHSGRVIGCTLYVATSGGLIAYGSNQLTPTLLARADEVIE